MVATDAGLSRDFSAQFAEPLEQVLDLDTWSAGLDLDRGLARIYEEVHDALGQDQGHRSTIRQRVFPVLARRPGHAPGAGVYRATIDDLRAAHQGLLFTGAVEAADGTVAVHETLPLSVTQIGVSLVSYNGSEGTWQHRLYRRDLRAQNSDPAEEILALLEARQRRGAFTHEQETDTLSRLTRRGLMTYAERAVLVHRSRALWRMGHGSPAAIELFTAAAEPFLDASIAVMRALITEHRRFVYVPSTPAKQLYATLAAALEPLEYAVIQTQEEELRHLVAREGHPALVGASLTKALDFAEEVGPQIVLGIYRASRMAPGQIFYAHVDHAHEAALIALADSILHEHRGFPLLIDLADRVCAAHFSAGSFAAGMDAAYAAAGASYQYFHERATRKG